MVARRRWRRVRGLGDSPRDRHRGVRVRESVETIHECLGVRWTVKVHEPADPDAPIDPARFGLPVPPGRPDGWSRPWKTEQTPPVLDHGDQFTNKHG